MNSKSFLTLFFLLLIFNDALARDGEYSTLKDKLSQYNSGCFVRSQEYESAFCGKQREEFPVAFAVELADFDMSPGDWVGGEYETIYFGNMFNTVQLALARIGVEDTDSGVDVLIKEVHGVEAEVAKTLTMASEVDGAAEELIVETAENEQRLKALTLRLDRVRELLAE